ELNLGEAAQGAPLGGGASVEGRCETRELAEGVAVGETASVDVAVAHFVTDITADLQAGLGARDVEEAGAVGVADADIFHRLWLCDDDRVSSLSRNSDSSRCGAEKKALDVHFLTSSQSYKTGLGIFYAEGQLVPAPSPI